MTAPSIREALEELMEAVRRDADEGGKGISGYTSARLSDAKSALAAPPQDVVEGAEETPPGGLDAPHNSGERDPSVMPDYLPGGTELRVRARLAWNNWPDSDESRRIIANHEARDKYSADAWDRVIAAILASGLVTHPEEASIRADEREKCARTADECFIHYVRQSDDPSEHVIQSRVDIAAAIRAGGAK